MGFRQIESEMEWFIFSEIESDHWSSQTLVDTPKLHNGGWVDEAHEAQFGR